MADSNTTPLISIIIPIYNTEEYLNPCIESVVKQSYRNLEILLIDDGSTDACAQIVDEWADKDSRVQAIHQKNQGLSVTRNHGLDLAHGEFIAFVDSDDFIHPNMYEALYHAIVAEGADISQCRYQKFELTEEISTLSSQSGSFYHLDRTQTPSEYLPGFWNAFIPESYSVVWNKLYRRELIYSNNLQFLPHYLSEDAYFNTDIFCKAQKITFLSDVLYYYRQRPTSLRFSFPDTFLIHQVNALAYQKSKLDEVLPSNLLSTNCYTYLNTIADKLVQFSICKQTTVYREAYRTFCGLYDKKRDFKKKPLEEMKLFLARYCYPLYFALKYHSVSKRLYH